MGKSQASFSKKEKEKKKIKKREDKEQKKEERKANSNKGKAIDHMMAYLDENGNITSTPPDPTRTKAVKQEDIQIGVPRQEPLDPADLVRKGTLTNFNTSKGYGFIKDHVTQESIFVHYNNMIGLVKENDKVTFEVEKGQKGLNAIHVKAIV